MKKKVGVVRLVEGLILSEVVFGMEVSREARGGRGRLVEVGDFEKVVGRELRRGYALVLEVLEDAWERWRWWEGRVGGCQDLFDRT